MMRDYKKYFIGAIRKNYPDKVEAWIAETDHHYEYISIDIQFAATSKNPIDKRLDFCAYFLAFIKTLDSQGEKFEAIRKICLEVVMEYVRPKNKFQQLVKRLPAKFIDSWLATFFLKEFHKRVSGKNEPGFVANIITDKKETYGLGYGIDILECGICKLFHKHHAHQYVSILCEVDEVTSGLAGLTLIRTGTIANGANKCDFRWKKEK
jgi:L-2-amino-thiazoline-4-carboxylic acid hydrolase